MLTNSCCLRIDHGPSYYACIERSAYFPICQPEIKRMDLWSTFIPCWISSMCKLNPATTATGCLTANATPLKLGYGSVLEMCHQKIQLSPVPLSWVLSCSNACTSSTVGFVFAGNGAHLTLASAYDAAVFEFIWKNSSPLERSSFRLRAQISVSKK